MNQTQSPTHQGYGGQPARHSPEGGLPFTGADIPLLLVAGVILIAIGLVLRNLKRNPA